MTDGIRHASRCCSLTLVKADVRRFALFLQTVPPLLMALLAAGCSGDAVPSQATADLVLINGKIVTMDPAMESAEALSIRGDRIVAVGSTEEIRGQIGDHTEVLDLHGKLAIPGFIEGHGHFLALGRSLAELDLTRNPTWASVVEQVAEAIDTTPAGEWILGRGWHQSKWEVAPEPSVAGLPYHDALSAVSADNPVLLTHASGHAVLANRRAMDLAGIGPSTPDPSGGEIVRDAEGRAIGVFRENAAGLIRDAGEVGWNEVAARHWVDLATAESLRRGITSFQDAGSSVATVELFKELATAGELGVRLWVMVRESNEVLAESLGALRVVGLGNGFLTVRAIKQSIDGALGTHGAWLLDPYDDLPSSRGLSTTSPKVLRETARLAVEHDFQLCVHAIGDRGNRETLDIFEEAYATDSQRDWRWRIEHAQHLDHEDVGRFAGLGVIASMQGVHCTSDGPWVPSRIGDRRSREGAYLWRDLIDSGAIVINGTDTPVEAVDPLASYFASVTRELADGQLFYPEQRMTREEALRSYTLDAAFAAFEEDEKGSLSVGKLADITVLSKDILTIASAEILETEILYTLVGGSIRYRRE